MLFVCIQQLAPLAADDRPTGPGEQVDPQHGEAEQPLRDQADRFGHGPNARELRPVRDSSAAGERRWRDGPAAGAAAAEADVQGGRDAVHQAGRQCCRVQHGLPVVHHDQAPQSKLPAGNRREGWLLEKPTILTTVKVGFFKNLLYWLPWRLASLETYFGELFFLLVILPFMSSCFQASVRQIFDFHFVLWLLIWWQKCVCNCKCNCYCNWVICIVPHTEDRGRITKQSLVFLVSGTKMFVIDDEK